MMKASVSNLYSVIPLEIEDLFRGAPLEITLEGPPPKLGIVLDTILIKVQNNYIRFLTKK